MGKFDFNKFRDILKIGTGIGKQFAPGAVGSILDVVNKGLNDKNDPANEEAIKALAVDNDSQNEQINSMTAAILALHERIKKLESK